MRAMLHAMEHRGPDDEGIRISGQEPLVQLGHRRLSIIDLSAAGHQPLSNERGTVWVVLNGEIYNFHELKDQLIAQGHTFASATDTEVIVHLYEEYGVDCINQLRGMFAFALWDESKKMLFIGRDRVGKKPLFYHNRNSIFCFASELAALCASGLIRKQVSAAALDHYLSFGYVPAPASIFEGVCKLMPGHYLTVQEGNIRDVAYWSLKYDDKIDIPGQEAEEELIRLLDESVKIRMYSDVPLGAFLSGGVDSSAVVAIMARHAGRVKTFSIGFEDDDYSELKYARAIAQRYSTDHHEFIVKPNAVDILPVLVERYGEPYADSSCIPTYYVSRETKRFVTVALNGDGGDESFAGYERYQAMLIADRIASMPAIARTAMQGLCSVLPDSVDPKNKFRRIRRFFDAAYLPQHSRYMKWVSIFDERMKQALYEPRFAAQLSAGSSDAAMGALFSHYRHSSVLDTLLDIDIHSYLPDDLLVKVDIASMANSLECRSPFLDTRLMEFAARLPVGFKLRGSVKKYVLKKAVERFVPKQNLYRRKMGFGVPVGKWFRSELNGFLRDTLLSSACVRRGYFRPGVIKNLVEAHSAGRADHSFQLWALLMLEAWHEKFMD